MGVRPVQSVGQAVVHVVRLGGRVEVLHGAEVLGSDGLEGRRSETRLEEEKQECRHGSWFRVFLEPRDRNS